MPSDAYTTPAVAILVFHPLKQRRADDSFDGNDNFGAKVIRDVLERAGQPVGFCSPHSATDHQVVLVSLTSTFDVLSFYQQVAMLPTWQPGKRTFRVVAGGFGMQNPTPIRNYLDYAAFGRAESFAPQLVAAALDRKPFTHPSVMNLPDLHPVVMCQTKAVYPHQVEDRAEDFIGCQRKCRFCHYAWSRRPVNVGRYYSKLFSGHSSPELELPQVRQLTQKAGSIRTAVDGFSERLRFAYGKPYTNDFIVECIEHVASFGGNTLLQTYNIGNFPTETDADREELYQTFARVRLPAGTEVGIMLQTTPFRPSLLTPMQWEPVSLDPNWSDGRRHIIHRGHGLTVRHSKGNEGPWTHLQVVVCERATPDTDKLFHAMAFARGFNAGLHDVRVMLAKQTFDLSPYLREYDIDEPPPAPFLSSYTPIENLRKLARKLRADTGRSV